MNTTIIQIIPTDFELGLDFVQPSTSAQTPSQSSALAPTLPPTPSPGADPPAPPKKPAVHFTPGELVRLYPLNRQNPHEFFGCLSRPVLILKTINPKLTLVAPVLSSPSYAPHSLPFLLNGTPLYLSLPNLRVIRNSRLLATRRLGQISPFVLSQLSSHLVHFLITDFTPLQKTKVDV